jgi:hypothetical protein
MSAVSDFFSSLKEDLMGRRLLPFLVVLGVVLVGAVAYAVIGGGSSTSTVAVSASSGSTVVAGVAVSQAPANPNQPISETTEGTSKQHHGIAHNPFTPLPTAKQASATSAKSATTSSSAGSSGTSSSGSGTSTSSAGGATPTPAPAPAPTAPAKPKPEPIYHVLALFGLAPVAPALSSPLTPYENIKRLTPLPSAQAPLVVFMGVTAGGKSATFALVGEAILHGNGVCLPSASQCQAIDLQPGHSEQLEYLPPDGQTITYELKVASISSNKASASAAQHSYRLQSRAGVLRPCPSCITPRTRACWCSPATRPSARALTPRATTGAEPRQIASANKLRRTWRSV